MTKVLDIVVLTRDRLYYLKDSIDQLSMLHRYWKELTDLILTFLDADVDLLIIKDNEVQIYKEEPSIEEYKKIADKSININSIFLARKKYYAGRIMYIAYIGQEVKYIPPLEKIKAMIASW